MDFKIPTDFILKSESYLYQPDWLLKIPLGVIADLMATTIFIDLVPWLRRCEHAQYQTGSMCNMSMLGHIVVVVCSQSC